MRTANANGVYKNKIPGTQPEIEIYLLLRRLRQPMGEVTKTKCDRQIISSANYTDGDGNIEESYQMMEGGRWNKIAPA